MKKFFWSFGPLLWFILILSCGGKSQNSTQILDPLQAREWIRMNPSGQLVDVRTPEEYAQGHIAGSKLLPIQELESRQGEIRKDKPVLLYCHSGRWSQTAFDLLRRKGFQNLYQIGGGMTAWKEKGLPVELGLK